MKKVIHAAVCAALALAGSAALAQETEGNWMVRVRALHLQPANHSDAGLGGLLPEDAIEVSDKWIPEVDISYFFTKHIAAELVLTIPQKHDVTITKGALAGTSVGTFKHLPPSLLLQYHFTPEATFRPYVGAGINYTRMMDVNFDGVPGADLENSSVGPALQIGFDIKVGKNSFINVDVKKLYIEADVTLNGAKISTVNVDPLLWGVGYGFKF